MRWIAILRLRLRSLFRPAEVERELREELQFHASHASLGGVEHIKEECRDARGLQLFENLCRDVRYGLRLLARTPGFTIAAVLTLALGIGVNSAIFSVVDAVMLRPLPYPDSDRLVAVWESTHSSGRSSVSPGNLADYQQASLFASMSAWSFNGTNITSDGPAERLTGTLVNYNYFDVLGVKPALGRNFLREDDQPQRGNEVILSWELWERRYGLDPGLIGRTIVLDGVPHEVVGIMPSGFAPPHQIGNTQRIEIYSTFAFPPELLANRGDHEVNILGRLKPGVTVSQAQADLDAISERLAKDYPKTNGEVRAHTSALRDDIVRTVRPALRVLLGAVALILLVACVNVANLLLARSLVYRREVAMLLALGASRARICGGLLVQSLLLSGMGCALGLLLGTWTRRALVNLAPQGLPRIQAATLDWQVLVFTMLVAAAATVLFGLLPAWQTSSVSAGDVLKGGTRATVGAGVMRWRSVLLVLEVALSLMLTVGAGLLLRSFVHLSGVDLGFKTDHVLAMIIQLPQSQYPTPESRISFFERLEERARALPGVEGSFYTSQLPMRGGWETGIETEDAPVEPGTRIPSVASKAVSPSFFRALSLALVSGRLLTPADRDGALPVIVINEKLAKQFWPGQDPLGRRLRRGAGAPWLTVVGVVRDARLYGQDEDILPHMFIPAAQTKSYPVRLANFGVRTSGDPWKLLGPIQSAVRALDRDQPIFQPTTFDELISLRIADRRFMAALLLVFAAVSLALALVGVYGVMAYAVSQRVPEIGLRVALGAKPDDILRLFLRRAFALTLAGVVCGVAAAAALSKYLTTLLFEIKPTDAATFAVVAGLVTVAAVTACYLPARRASRVDPMVALRHD